MPADPSQVLSARRAPGAKPTLDSNPAGASPRGCARVLRTWHPLPETVQSCRSPGTSEQPVGGVVEAAQGVVVDDDAGDAAVGRRGPGPAA